MTREDPDLRDMAEWRALARTFTGAPAPGDPALVARQLDADPARRRLLALLRDHAPPAGVRPDVERAWAAVSARLDAADGRRRPTPRALPRLVPAPASPAWRRPALLAAALAGIAVLGVAGRLVLGHWTGGGARVEATAVSEWRSVTLPDGSVAVLAPVTRLRVPARFGDGRRDVALDGEAHFQVAHRPGARFRVLTARAVVEDVGTAFAVRARAGDGAAAVDRVVVTDGAVTVRARGEGADTAHLRRADLAEIPGDGGRVVVRRGVALAPYTAWLERRLAFEGAPLREVGAELGRWYGVTVRFVPESVAARRLTATLPADSLDASLATIALALELDVARSRDTVEFRAR